MKINFATPTIQPRQFTPASATDKGSFFSTFAAAKHGSFFDEETTGHSFFDDEPNGTMSTTCRRLNVLG